MSLTDIKSKLIAEQQPLGEDLEAILLSNLDELYEEEDDNEGEASDREKFEAHLDTLTLAQMKEYAKEGEMPEEEYEKLNSKKLMKAYLLKKYDEAEAAGELDEEDDEEEDDSEGGEQ
jgi:hypothetical protein